MDVTDQSLQLQTVALKFFFRKIHMILTFKVQTFQSKNHKERDMLDIHSILLNKA